MTVYKWTRSNIPRDFVLQVKPSLADVGFECVNTDGQVKCANRNICSLSSDDSYGLVMALRKVKKNEIKYKDNENQEVQKETRKQTHK